MPYKMDGFYYKSYGWPLVWHRYVAEILAVPNGTIGWYYSASRLAANLAMWLVLLAAPGAACEWVLRRYRPRLRWRLRTMLVAIGLPALPQLELLDLQSSPANDRDLPHISALPRLRSLNLRGTRVTAAGLVQLAPLESLEELAIDDDESDMVSAAGLESLQALKRLDRLHIDRLKLNGPTPNFSLPLDQGSELYVPEDKVEDFRRAIEDLRRNNSRIVIDNKENTFGPRETWWALPWFDYDALPDHHPAWLPVSDGPWMPPAARAKYEADGRCEF